MIICSFKHQCVVVKLHSTEATVASLALGPKEIFTVDVKSATQALVAKTSF